MSPVTRADPLVRTRSGGGAGRQPADGWHGPCRTPDRRCPMTSVRRFLERYPTTKLPLSRRRTLSGLLVAGTASALVAVGGPAMADEVLIWNGFGWSGRSAEIAVDHAIDDVETMAAGEGQFDCELIPGRTFIWERFDPQTGAH